MKHVVIDIGADQVGMDLNHFTNLQTRFTGHKIRGLL